MKLTVEISDELHRRAKTRAALEGGTLSDVVRAQLEEFAAGLRNASSGDDVRAIREAKARYAQQRLAQLGRALGAEAERQGLSEEDLVTEMEEDRQAVYDELYGRGAGE